MRQINNNDELFKDLLIRTIEDLEYILENYIDYLKKEDIEELRKDLINIKNVLNWNDLKTIIMKWEKFNKLLWDICASNFNEFNNDKNYMFIVHVVSNLIKIPANVHLIKTTKDYFCCSLINEVHHALYENSKYGFVCKINGGFIGAYERDASTIVRNEKNEYSIHKLNDKYIHSYEPITLTRTPKHILDVNNKETIKYNGKLFNYTNFNNYNEIIVDKDRLEIIGMFYYSSISNDDLEKVISISKKNKLKLIRIKDKNKQRK